MPEIDPLTPRELRLIALMLEGLTTENLQLELGVDSVALQEARSSISRKMSLPDRAPLEDVLQEKLSSAIRAFDKETFEAEPPSDEERRVRLLLRLTLNDLRRVAADAELRAGMLEVTVKQLGSESLQEAAREVDDLREAADQIRRLAEALLEQVRRS